MICVPFNRDRMMIPCCECGAEPERPHIVGLAAYCAGCCPCNAAPAEHTAPVEGMAGEQMRLA